jgi:hypothetical protein
MVLHALEVGHQDMKRKLYNQNRAELDQETYRDGFLSGWLDGTETAIEQLQVDEFTYAEYFNPAPSDFKLVAEGEPPEDTPAQKLAYQIGYSDAFDRGYRNNRIAVDRAFREIRGISITDSFP